MIMTLYDKSLIRPTQLVHTQLEKKEWEVRGSSGDISLTDIYGKTFGRREQILKTQKDKTKESTKWLSHGIFKAVHTWAPRTLVRPRPEKKKKKNGKSP